MGPLAGVRIVEFAGIGPGPFCAMMLSDMGADVVRIERRRDPSDDRPLDLFNPGKFGVLDRGRRSVALDLKDANDLELALQLIEKADGLYLEITVEKVWVERVARPLVTTDLLGKAKVSDLPYLKPDRTPYRLDTDYLGEKRNADSPFPGPLELPQGGRQVLKVWPVESAQ